MASTRPDSTAARGPLSDSIQQQQSKIIVLKIGTSTICDEKTFIPKLSNLSLLVEAIVGLRNRGHQVILVSSGAVGVGLRRLSLSKRPKHLAQVQAVAAVGQGRLMALYDSLFSQFQLPIAQVLLTRDNLAERGQYLNACNTLRELLALGVLPIINENDTVSHAEIRFGDNDSLSAIAAGMVHADYLFLLTDVDCLYTNNPRVDPNAKAIRIVRDIPALKKQVDVSSAGSSIGTGGMVTKLIAAELAGSAGCSTVITLGSRPQDVLLILDQILQGGTDVSFQPSTGTLFVAPPRRLLEDRKWWILHGLSPAGVLTIDAGAARALSTKGSLFAAGITHLEGTFNSQQAVRILGPNGKDIARGIVNYTSLEIARIKGAQSSAIMDILGYCETEEVVHRNNLALLVDQTPKEEQESMMP